MKMTSFPGPRAVPARSSSIRSTSVSFLCALAVLRCVGFLTRCGRGTVRAPADSRTARSAIATSLCAAFLFAGGLAHAQEQVVRPFNGKDLTGWKSKTEGQTQSHWKVGTAKPSASDPKVFDVSPGGNELINHTSGHGQSLDLYSVATHGDALIKVEVMVPKSSNSGIYIMGEYEVQVLDSYGKDQNPGAGDMGAVYGAKPPKSPVYRKPGEWNTYEIHWRAPKFDAAGKKTANAMFRKVILNGATIHENLEMPGPTPGGVDGKEKARGPILFQGNHGPVAYRNIEILPLPK